MLLVRSSLLALGFILAWNDPVVCVNNPYAAYIAKDRASIKATQLRHPNIPPLDLRFSRYVNVSVHPVIIAIEGVDEAKNELSLSAVIEFIWDVTPSGPNVPDSTGFIFTVAEVGGSSAMWTPKIAIRNVLNVDVLRNAIEKSPVDIMSPSMAWWRLFNKYRLSCTFRVYSYPYDTQICQINFILMTDYNVVLFNTQMEFPICDQFYVSNPQWNLLGSRNYVKSYAYGVQEYVIEYVLVRKPQFYFLSVMLPIILLAIAGICIFLVEAGSDEKMQIAFTISLSFFVIFCNVVNSMPSNADIDSMPIIYWLLLALFSISIAASVYASILLRLIDYSEKDETVRFSYWIKKIFIDKITRPKKKITPDMPVKFGDSLSRQSTMMELTARNKMKRNARRLQMANNVGLALYSLLVVITTVVFGVTYKSDIDVYTPDYKATGENATFMLKGNMYFKPVSTFELCYKCMMDVPNKKITCPEALKYSG